MEMKIASVAFSLIFTFVILTIVSSEDHLRSFTAQHTSPFLFGTASSAYQYEGAYISEGKGLNNWDTFTHNTGNIADGSDGDAATDHYHRYQEDVNLMADLGVNSYRFSISWARILPKGRYGHVNLAGISFYNKLIDALLQKGIEPFVTLSHFDIPQELQDRYGSWLSTKIVEDYRYYADICFKSFGDRVKYWVTFNEPNIMIIAGYRRGIYPPNRCSLPYGNCTDGDSEKEPFVAGHNIILAHAVAANLYKTSYQKQGGIIGIVLHAIWFEPISDSLTDKMAAKRAQSFTTNWFLDPLILGEYPAEMKEILGANLPEFSREDQKILQKSLDFIGINHYTSWYAEDCIYSQSKRRQGCSKAEGFCYTTTQKNGVSIGEPTGVDWLFNCPQGMENIIYYVKKRYNNMPIFITENGSAQDSSNCSTKELLYDFSRVDYMSGYLNAMLRAMRNGADVRGYFAWSLLDNFEWLYGYTKRFGLHHVDYRSMKRTPKASAMWYKKFITKTGGRKGMREGINNKSSV